MLAVRLTPKSSRDAVEGAQAFDGKPVLAARVRAIPDKGKANAALEKLIAKWLGVPKSSVALASGSTSRLKTLQIAGEADALETLIEQKLAELP